MSSLCYQMETKTPPGDDAIVSYPAGGSCFARMRATSFRSIGLQVYSVLAVNGVFACLVVNSFFALLCFNSFFSLMSVNAIFSVLSLNSIFSVLSVNCIGCIMCSGKQFCILGVSYIANTTAAVSG